MFDADFRNFRLERDERDVLTVVLDVTERPVNVFDESVISELEMIVSRLEEASDLRAVVFQSSKESGFLAGADVRKIAELADAGEGENISATGQTLFDRIERLPMPTVAVIHGPCLGGGLEFALACRHRIARDDASTRLGLPEVQLGILPAWGGTQRLPRRIGLLRALPMILQGRKLSAKQAAEVGLVDLVAPPDTFDVQVQRFLGRLLDSPTSVGVPSVRRQSLLARFANNTRLGRWIAFRAIERRIAREAKHYPAVKEALEAVKRGLQRSREEGLAYEREAVARLLFTPACRNLMQLYFSRERARNVKTWTKDMGHAASVPDSGVSEDRQETDAGRTDGHAGSVPHVGRVGVVGAGTMGAGIAQLASWQGLPVVLREVNQELVEVGMQRIGKLFDEAVRKGALRKDEAAARLAAITPTVEWEPLADADLVIEAVVEREDIKRQVFEELEKRVRPEAVLATNTSSLSVERLAQAASRPQRVAGLHFFNPVHRMELVEVVRAEATADATIEALVRFVRRLGKTPIVVNDSPGFLVNRVLFPYLGEAVRLVIEGHNVSEIDREAKWFGMPMGPLELLDQVGLDVAASVADSMTAVLTDAEPVAERLGAMVEKGRLGKKSGRGFYEYGNGRRGKPTVWEGEAATPPELPETGKGEFSMIQQRLILPIVNEAARCLEENVVGEAWVVDLAMVLGTGFAPFRGGPLRLADDLGLDRVITDLRNLAESYGERFAPCGLLCRLADEGKTFHEKPVRPTGAERPIAQATS